MGVMASGRVNSKGSLETASRMLRSYGDSWAAVEKAAKRDEKGVYVVKRNASAAAGSVLQGASDKRR